MFYKYVPSFITEVSSATSRLGSLHSQWSCGAKMLRIIISMASAILSNNQTINKQSKNKTLVVTVKPTHRAERSFCLVHKRFSPRTDRWEWRVSTERSQSLWPLRHLLPWMCLTDGGVGRSFWSYMHGSKSGDVYTLPSVGLANSRGTGAPSVSATASSSSCWAILTPCSWFSPSSSERVLSPVRRKRTTLPRERKTAACVNICFPVCLSLFSLM